MFFEDGDYALYLDLLSEASAQARVAIWGYCLMPNHVHIIGSQAWLADMEAQTGMVLAPRKRGPAPKGKT